MREARVPGGVRGQSSGQRSERERWRCVRTGAGTFYGLYKRLREDDSCNRDITVTPWGNLIKFVTNVHFDSRVKWLKSGGQRSKLKARWPHKTWLVAWTQHLSNILRKFFRFGSNVQWTDWILVIKHQKSPLPHKTCFWPQFKNSQAN